MKNYPYIHSLSTVGLIHHYNRDYIFNRTRTDFTGDSGTGKSMIADLLQLVFVGSSVFEAATASIDEKRTPKGMVLYDKTKGFGGKGYAFLNIAIEEQQYLVIGIYLEQSTNAARPFVIHKGYDLDNPTYLNNTLLHEQFLHNENILPIGDLKEYLKKVDHNCEPLQLSNYHKFLYNQEILPFDLANNPDKLNTYALIIRSFSRGKGFKFDTQHLQDFLFGTDKEKKILNSYETQVEKIKSSFQDSENFQKQIALLKDKKSGVKDLASLERQKNELLKQYLDIRLHYYSNDLKTKEQEKDTNAAELINVLLENNLLEQKDNQQKIEVVEKEITEIKTFLKKNQSESELRQKEDSTQKTYLVAKKVKDQVNTIQSLLPQFNNSIENIKDYYYSQNQNQKEREKLDDFNRELIEQSILDDFENSDWALDYTKALNDYNHRLKELDIEIVTNKALQKFSDVTEPASLANWAINRSKEFSHEEESALVKLNELIVAVPENKDLTYIPKPEELFDNIQWQEGDKDGFWLNLSGTYQYIAYVPKQFLNTSSVEEKQKFFHNQHSTAQEALAKAKKEKEDIQKLHDALHAISGLQSNIELYKKKEAIKGFKVLNSLSLQKEEFETVLANCQQEDQIQENFRQAKKTWEKAHSDFKELEKLSKQFSRGEDPNNLLQKKKKLFNKLTNQKTFLKTVMVRRKSVYECDDKKLTNKETVLEKSIDESSLATVYGDKKSEEARLWESRKSLKREIKKIQKNFKDLEEEYKTYKISKTKEVIRKDITSKEVEEIRENYQESKNAYRMAINSLVDKYLAHDKYKYEQEDDWRKIARGLLPEVFKTAEITEEQFSSEIDERLQNIIDQNTVIGDRKVELLNDVFSKVEGAFSQFSNEIDNLRAFFNGNDKRITGGHKVNLKFDRSQDYPINWISTFKKQMREESLNRTGLFKIVDEGIDFKEIIQKCFKQCGGKKSNPKIQDLLNPKKYFELSFSLQKDNIKNSGSTGQVYSAIALLCIARISLIEKDEGGKRRKGVRFMPVDEAEGLGSNYEMLSNIAKKEDYQIISMSINPVGEFEEGNHYIYMLNEPEDETVRINGEPFAQFTEEEITKNIQEFSFEAYDE